MKNKFSFLIIISGILITLFFLFADVMGLGKSGIHAAQILGMEIGIIIVLFGITLIILQKKRESSALPFWRVLRDRIYNLPILFWVVLGVLPAFILFLAIPMFFSPSRNIQYPVAYLQSIHPIGNDLRDLLSAVKSWLLHNRTTAYAFTPATILLFAPLFLLGYPSAYYFIVITTLASYLILACLAMVMSENRQHPVVVFIATISLFSYGLQFELERGQSHTIALMLCVLAIYIFHKHPDFRLFAYLLFCVSIQIKLYPALFVVMFVDDWRDWKTNLIRFGALGLINILALFLLGFSYFSAFYHQTTDSLGKAEIWIGNHSIKSFVGVLPAIGVNFFNGDVLNWFKNKSSLISAVLVILCLICFLTVLINAYIKNISGINVDLLLVCVIIGIVVPSVSHDYSLPLLMAPFAMFISGMDTREFPWTKIFTVCLIILLSFIYSLTLFPTIYKPIYLQNSFPILFAILIIVTVLHIVPRRQSLEA
jgi:hypothetical protein